jgi:hypothetical protein
MEIPETLREIVDRLGTALVEALAQDKESRALVMEIQAQGFDMALILEATVALHKREPGEEATSPTGQVTLRDPAGPWSDEDKAFLRTFKISL